MRIGLFGGTFDPIHVGHLDVARAALEAVNLDRVLLVPARMPPHRHHPQASAAHRFAMTALAVADAPSFGLSDVEMDAPGPSYTVDTLDRWMTSGSTQADTLFFVIGADAFVDIPSWRAYPAVLYRCHFIVVSRPGLAVTALAARLPDLANRMIDAAAPTPKTPSIILVDAPTAPVSSTAVREACSRGQSIEGLVPPAVADYIQRQRLYSKTTETDHE